MQNIYPVITLYQPWATWIMRGWKTIETRTHDRFACLTGKTILIHAGMKTDIAAANNPYLTRDQLMQDPDEVINGFILGEVHVKSFSKLNGGHSKASLIDCGTVERFGLFLSSPCKFVQPIEISGERGIWYYDLENMRKVKASLLKPAATGSGN